MGDPVALINGSIQSTAASPVAGTLSANTPIGIFMGVSYIDPVRGFVNSQVLKAGAVTAGYTNILVKVCDDPTALFEIQAEGTVPASAVGSTVALKNFNAADMVVKTSRVEADHATLSKSSTSTAALRIHKIDPGVGNTAGDTYTRLIVRWNNGVHAYSFAGTQ
jgi:hypothetical protein